jgi:hypothetical protein
MRSIFAAIAVVLLLGSTAYGDWYVGPRVVYYPAAPVYAYPAPAPLYAYPAPVYAYRVPIVAPAPYVAYSPVVPAPAFAPAPVIAPPLVAPAPVVVRTPRVVVRTKVYYPWQPARNVVKAVLP